MTRDDAASTPLPFVQLKEARLYRTGTPGVYDRTVFYSMPPSQTSGSDSVTPGQKLCHVVTYLDIDGLESDFSNEVCHVGTNAKPAKSTMTSKP
jgi:hypothetical protein